MRSLMRFTLATVAVCISFSRGSVAVRSWWLSRDFVALADRGWAVPLSEALRMKEDRRADCERRIREVDKDIAFLNTMACLHKKNCVSGTVG